MKREDVSKIFQEATEEQITALLDINSKDIGNMKQERDAYKTQLEAAQETLKGFEGVDVGQLQGEIRKLTGDIETMKTTHQRELADRDFNDSLKAAITAAGGRSEKAVMAMLDVDKLRESKNQDADIAAALETVKKENDYLFQTGGTTPRVVASTSTSQADTTDRKAKANEAFRALIGKEN